MFLWTHHTRPVLHASMPPHLMEKRLGKGVTLFATLWKERRGWLDQPVPLECLKATGMTKQPRKYIKLPLGEFVAQQVFLAK